MAAKLKNLSVTSVDLVDQGANPDARVCLFKRREGEAETGPDTGMFEKFAQWLAKGFQAATGEKPDEGTVEENVEDESSATVRAAASEWAKEQKAARPQEEQAGIQKSTAQQDALAKLLEQYGFGAAPAIQEPQGEKEETDTMKIDKSKMNPEEAATLAEFEKKYGVADDPPAGGEPAPQDGVEKVAEPTSAPAPSATLHPEVQKALADFQEMNKRRDAEVEELKKSLEIERLTSVAKKYEVLGKNAGELAAKLYELKKAGGTVYDDYVALLDENLTTLTKSGLFGEIGRNTQGSAGAAQSIGIKAAELSKSAQGGMTAPDAIIKAFEENPELAAQYEAEYFGR